MKEEGENLVGREQTFYLERAENILILDSDPVSLDLAEKKLSAEMPHAHVVCAGTFKEFEKLISEKAYDVVVLDFEFGSECDVNIVRQLKLLNEEPAVLIMASSHNPDDVAAVYNSGSDRCINKEANWTEELGAAVRNILRFRRLEQENQNLLSKLTEANILLGEKNKRLDEFSATVAHDIRGPLAGISMKLEYLLDTYEKDIDDRFQTLLGRALESSHRLTEMVQSMYGFARLGKEAAKMEGVNLEKLVEEVVSDIPFDEALDINIGIGELPEVWGSPQLLRRVFINLITNAVKFNDKSHIVVNVGFSDIKEKSMARFCEVYVEDNGPGIEDDELRDIFHMFSRGVANASQVEGSGIGLSVVQRIIELHFGEIRVESKVGEGTRFIVSLPMAKIDFIK